MLNNRALIYRFDFLTTSVSTVRFLIEMLMFMLNAIKCHSKGSYAEQNLTLVIISYEIYKTPKARVRFSIYTKVHTCTSSYSFFFLFSGVFLLCWWPFFTVNIMRAICLRYEVLNYPKCDIDVNLMAFFVWLGYINSFLNPVIYTIFNPEFRKAFKKILTECCKICDCCS